MTIIVSHSEMGNIRLNPSSIVYIRQPHSGEDGVHQDLEIRTNQGIFFSKHNPELLKHFVKFKPVLRGGFPSNYADNHDLYLNANLVVCIYDLESTKEDPRILVDYDKWSMEIHSAFQDFYLEVNEKTLGNIQGVSLNESVKKITDIRKNTSFNLCYNDSYVSYITPMQDGSQGSIVEFLPTSKILPRIHVNENIWR